MNIQKAMNNITSQWFDQYCYLVSTYKMALAKQMVIGTENG